MRALSPPIVLLLASACLVSADMVTYNATDKNCDGDPETDASLVRQCNAQLEAVRESIRTAGTYTLGEDCRILQETIACIETALCDCAFGPQALALELGYRSLMNLYHVFNNISSCGNASYESSSQSAFVFGPIAVTPGIDCTKYGKTPLNLTLSLTFSTSDAVKEKADQCPGFEQCHATHDQAVGWALYTKNWPGFCGANVQLLDCLDRVVCACNLFANRSMVEWLNYEAELHYGSCSVLTEGSPPRVAITCQASCDYPDPLFNCLVTYDVATKDTTAQTCRALYTLSACTETLACDCGFYQHASYYRSLAINKHEYVDQYKCEDVAITSINSCYNSFSSLAKCDLGEMVYLPFPNRIGLNCTPKDGDPTPDEILLSSYSTNATFVAQEQRSCPGIKSCYDTSDSAQLTALHDRDLKAFCSADGSRIRCVEQVYCDCGRLVDTDVDNRMYEERRVHDLLCFSAVGVTPITRCRGKSTCQQRTPLNVCSLENGYDTAVAQNDTTKLCNATMQHVQCIKEVGCGCDLLSDSGSAIATAIVNSFTSTIDSYNNQNCPRLTGVIAKEEGGITCQATVDPTGAGNALALSCWLGFFLLTREVFRVVCP